MADACRYSLNWDLDALDPHPESPAFREELTRFRESLMLLAESSDALPPVGGGRTSVEAWTGFLRDYETVAARGADLNSFVGCHAAAQAENKVFQRYEAELAALDPLRQRIATNVEFALKQASDQDVAAFLAGDEWLGEIAFFLQDARANAALRLPRELELLAAELGVDGIHAWGRLYDRLSGALRIKVMEKGEIVEKSPGQVQFDSPQRAVRENNFYAANNAWNTIAETCADAINHIAGTRLTLYRRSGLEDHLVAPLRYNRMRRETLEAMWSAVAERRPVLLDYLQAKAALLGLEKLAWFDVTAPLPSARAAASGTLPVRASDRGELSWDEACELVIDTFAGFSGELGEFARRAIEGRWIEAEDRPGKRQGGFCTGFPTKKQSRIFMTYTGSRDSASTLAHELGHAYHSYVLRDRPYFLRDYPMNLAETASTFAEAIVGEEQLRAAGEQRDRDSAGRQVGSPPRDEQLVILDQMLADAAAFLMNIHARFIFEDGFHRERPEGELPAERLSELMLTAQKEAYCDGLAEDGWYPGFWISKLHFYISSYPFYNFPYTFGYLLSLGLYALAAEAGEGFPQQYRDLLIATGCMETEEAVKSTVGYDLTEPAFWHKSLDIVQRRVEKFVELAGGGPVE